MPAATYLDGTPYNDYDDFMKGREALVEYHNAMIDFWPNVYKNIDFQTLVRGLSSRPGQKFFIDGLGLGIINADIDFKTVSMAMQNLARKSNGQVPASNSTFTQALTNQAIAASNFVDITVFTAIESAKDIIVGTEKIGNRIVGVADAAIDSSVSIIKSASWVVPIAVLGAVMVLAYGYSKK